MSETRQVTNPKTGEIRWFKFPSRRRLEHWVFDSVAETPDGCETEPDGSCEHGWPSWLIVLGLI